MDKEEDAQLESNTLFNIIHFLSYCPEGTPVEIPCDGGKYCGTIGLSEPSGDCSAGYYCIIGTTTITPTESSQGGYKCPKGSYCEEGVNAPMVN